jgi:hypothetical protein
MAFWACRETADRCKYNGLGLVMVIQIEGVPFAVGTEIFSEANREQVVLNSIYCRVFYAVISPARAFLGGKAPFVTLIREVA